MQRPQLQIILEDLKKKMVLLVGPRQAGKTTLAQMVASYYQNPVYLNFDNHLDRAMILNQTWLPSTDLLILKQTMLFPLRAPLPCLDCFFYSSMR
jgi:predicted AAA+ superfamily ATPase